VAKWVALVWVSVVKRRQRLGEEMYGLDGARLGGGPKWTLTEVVQNDCRSCKLNMEDAADRGGWRKQMGDD